jgi:type I restriction enzyme, S subunit
MSKLSYKFIPLTFISSKSEIKRQIRNTIIFSYLQRQYNQVQEFSEILESTQYGLNAAANELGGHKFLRISDIKEGQVNWENVPMCLCDDEATYKLYEDDILVARTGGTTGKSFLIKRPPENAVFAGYLIRLRAKNINPTIIYEFLSSYAYWSQISEMKMGSAQPNVNAQKLKKLKIPLAPKQVLDEIVKIFKGEKTELKELSDLIIQGLNNYDKAFEIDLCFDDQKNLLRKLRDSILQEAVQGKLTTKWREANPSVEHASELLKRIEAEKQQLIAEKKIRKEKPIPPIEEKEISFKLPERWEYSRVASVSTIKGGKRVPKGYALTDTPTPYIYIRVTDMKKGSVNLHGLKYIQQEVYEQIKTYTISKDDLYITIAGTIGNVGEIPQELDGMNLTENAAKIIYYQIDKKYLKTLLSSSVCQNQFMDKVNQMAQPKLALHRIGSTIIPIPPLDEQKIIVEKVNSLMALCDELEQQIDNSQTQIEQLMQSCLKEVFTES